MQCFFLIVRFGLHDIARTATASYRTYTQTTDMAKKKKSARERTGGAPKQAERPTPPSPEPEPVECNTCAHFFRKEDLFGCDIEQCEYMQCKDCIFNGPQSSMCNNVDCMCLHWSCPACIEGKNTMPLADECFTKQDILIILRGTRARALFVESTLDRVQPALAAMTAAFEALNTRLH